MWTILGFVVGAAVFAASLWVAVRIVGGSEGTNSWKAAAFFGVIFSVFGSFLGGFLVFLPLFALFLLLLRYYDLGVLRSVLVLIIMGALQLAFGFVLSAGLEAVASV